MDRLWAWPEAAYAYGVRKGNYRLMTSFAALHIFFLNVATGDVKVKVKMSVKTAIVHDHIIWTP